MFVTISAIKTSLIYPATERHIAKYSSQETFLIEESAEDYKNITLPFLESEQFTIEVSMHMNGAYSIHTHRETTEILLCTNTILIMYMYHVYYYLTITKILEDIHIHF